MKIKGSVIGFAVGFAVVLLVAVGCEKTNTGIILVVTPSSSTVQPSNAVMLTVSLPEADKTTRSIYYPLTWAVSKASLGSIRDEAGNTAVYVATTNEGVNTVTVRDQIGAEGIASITLLEPELPASTELPLSFE